MRRVNPLARGCTTSTRMMGSGYLLALTSNYGTWYHNWWYVGANRKLSFDQTPVDSPHALDRLGVNGEFDERWAGWSNVSIAWDEQGASQYMLHAGVKYTW